MAHSLDHKRVVGLQNYSKGFTKIYLVFYQ